MLVTEESQVSSVTLSFIMSCINQEKVLLACACMSTVKGDKESTSMADSCQCMAKATTDCKVIILQLKSINFLKKDLVYAYTMEYY